VSVSDVLPASPGGSSSLSIFRVCGGRACLVVPDLSGLVNTVGYVRVVIVDHLQVCGKPLPFTR
jgi:hypothetical protein